MLMQSGDDAEEEGRAVDGGRRPYPNRAVETARGASESLAFFSVHRHRTLRSGLCTHELIMYHECFSALGRIGVAVYLLAYRAPAKLATMEH